MAMKKTAAKTAPKKGKAKKNGPRTKAVKKPRTRSAVLQAHVDTFSTPPKETHPVLRSRDFTQVEEHEIPQVAWDAFLADLAETGHVTNSCERVGLKRITVYKYAQRNQEFHDKMEEAHAIGLKQLEDHAVKRATVGVRKDVYFQGEVVGYHMEASDQLLMFLLQGRDSRYKRKQEITGADGAALFLMKMSDEELDAEIAARQALLAEQGAEQ